MWVKDYMFKKVNTASPECSVKDAVCMMVEKRTNSLIVIDEEGKPMGTVSSYTLIKEVVPAYLKGDPVFSNFGAEGTFDKYAEKVQDKKLKDIMHTDIHILNEKDAMIEAASYSIHADRRLLPVVNDEGKLIGVITRTCIKNALYNVLFKDNPMDAKDGGLCNCHLRE
jgi:predicted transcriptional regulator